MQDVTAQPQSSHADRNPWQALAANWPWIQVYVRNLPERWGQTIWDGAKPHIELAHDLGPIQQRCTLTHEMFHLEFGEPCRSFCDDNERKVIDATARWLLPDVGELGGALARSDVHAAAEQLEVTVAVLADRITMLSHDESGQLAGMISAGKVGLSEARAAYGQRCDHRAAPHDCAPSGTRRGNHG
jgi:hypothetical protein